MSVELRYIREDEFADYVRAMFWAAGRPVDDAFVAERRRCTELEGALAVFDGGRLVATLGMRRLTIRLPSGAAVPLAALGQGGVLPEQAAMGHSRRMVMHLMGAAKEQGIAICGGTMAEWPGFGRFGWGPATYACSYEIETRRTRFRTDVAGGGGGCELVASDQALEVLPALHAQAARAGTTLVARDAQYWHVIVDRLNRGESLDFLEVGGGHPPPFFCLYRGGAGEPEGVCIYRILPSWRRGLSRTALDLIHFIHASPAAHLGMWRHLLSLALVEKINAQHFPVDEPLPWMLVDGRRVESAGAYDHIWLRILDLPVAFEQRGAGELSRPLRVRVADEQFGAVTTYEFTPDGGRLRVEGTRGEPDVETDVGAVAALFLGGTRLRPLVSAGRVKPRSEAVLRAYASLFAVTAQPFVDTEF